MVEDDARDEHVARLQSENASLRAEIAELKARLADLEERLGRTPRNSSMPPSQEGLSKPNRAQRRAEGRRQGKQPGAEGKHLAQVQDPDEVVVHAPSACPGCGAGLIDAQVVDDEVRQVFDGFRPPEDPSLRHRAPHGAGPVHVWMRSEGRRTP